MTAAPRRIGVLHRERRAKPLPPPDTYTPHQAPKILAAVEALWPNGIPKWVSIARRDWEITCWIWERGEAIPSDRTIRRVLRRPA